MYQQVSPRARRADGILWVIGFIACVMMLLPGMATASPPAPGPLPVQLHEDVHAGLGVVQVPFIENAGQVDPRVALYARTFAGTAFVTRRGDLVLRIPGKASRSRQGKVLHGPDWALVESPVGASGLHPVGSGASAANVSDLTGKQRTQWRTHLKTYAAVHVGQPWPGIRYDIHAHGDNVERFFTVAPGSTAGRIRMRVRGAESLVLRHGALVAATGVGDVVLSRPRAYQVIGGKRTPVAVAYVVKGHTYGFRLGDYDHGEPVTIDPQVQTASLASSNGTTYATAMTLGPSDEVYVAGITSSDAFPGTSGGAQPTNPGNQEDFVAALSSDLGTIIQSTYLTAGQVSSMVVGASGQLYVAGSVGTGVSLPASSGGAQPSFAGGTSDGFVVELSGDLKTIVGSTYVGGSDDDYVKGIAVAPNGNLYLAGSTFSTDFPMTSQGAQPANAGEDDAFLAEVSADLTSIVRATYSGSGGLQDSFNAVLVDASGEVYATGSTQMAVNNVLPQYIVVARFSSDLSTLDSAYIFDSSGYPWDVGNAITLAPDGSVYIAATTQAWTEPGTAGGAQDFNWNNGRNAGYVAHLSHDLSTLVQATFVGGSAYTDLNAIAVDSSGRVFVGGYASSADFPVTPDAIQTQPPATGQSECTLTELTPDLKAIAWSTFLGGIVSATSGSAACEYGSVGSAGQLYAAGDAEVARFDASLLDKSTTSTLAVDDPQDLTVAFNTTGTEPLTLSGSQLTVSASDSNMTELPTGRFVSTQLVPDGNIVVQGNCAQASNCSLSLTPGQDLYGTSLVRVAVTDGSNYEVVRGFNFTVNPPPAPTITGIHNVTITKGSTSSVSYSFNITGNGTLQTTVAVGGTVSKSTGQSACTSAGSCTVTLTPTANFTGTSKVIIDVYDTFEQLGVATFTFTIKNPATTGGGGGGGGALGPWDLLALVVLARMMAVRRRRAAH